MALVRGVIFDSICAGSIFQVTGSLSTTTGVAPARTIAAAQEMIVKVGKITSSLAPMPSALTATSSATEPFATATPLRWSTSFAIPSSRRRTNAPSDEIQPLSMQSARYLISLPFSSGWFTGITLECPRPLVHEDDARALRRETKRCLAQGNECAADLVMARRLSVE